MRDSSTNRRVLIDTALSKLDSYCCLVLHYVVLRLIHIQHNGQRVELGNSRDLFFDLLSWYTRQWLSHLRCQSKSYNRSACTSKQGCKEFGVDRLSIQHIRSSTDNGLLDLE